MKAIPSFVMEAQAGHRLSGATKDQLAQSKTDLNVLLDQAQQRANYLLTGHFSKSAFIITGIYAIYCLFTYGLEEYGMIYPDGLQIALTAGGFVILLLETAVFFESWQELGQLTEPDEASHGVQAILISYAGVLILSLSFFANGQGQEYSRYLPVFITFVLALPFVSLSLLLFKLKQNTDKAIRSFYTKQKAAIGPPPVQPQSTR